MQKKVCGDLMIEAETSVKRGSVEPPAKWQYAIEEMGQSKAKMENILRFG